MRNEILKYMYKRQLVTIIYISREGELTKRNIMIQQAKNEFFSGYCYYRNQVRTFRYKNVLAIFPVVNRESMVV